MAGESEQAGAQAAVKKARTGTHPTKGRKSSTDKEEGQVSQALRTVYQRAIDEDIPSEMLDLLKKLD